MKDNLEQKIKSLPNSPGIYQYFDEKGTLLYIGKAKDLKKRVKSYFYFTPSLKPNPNLSPRLLRMINQTKDLNYIVVDTEYDALVLENSLIKQLKPKYNILLRDDKTYPYIYIDLNEDFPRFEITRKVIKKSNIKYFGPFTSGAKDILESIYELFPLVQKKGNIKKQKKCLYYQIKRCLAPCEGYITKQEYAKIVKDAILYINDKKKILSKLTQKMQKLSEDLRFEEAAKIRDKIERIKSSLTLNTIDLAKPQDLDIFAIVLEEDRACGVKIFVREGKVTSSDHQIFKSEFGFDIEELYKTMLLNHYKNELPFLPNQIIIADDFSQKEDITNFIEYNFQKKIQIITPKKGEKKRLVDLAIKNAKEILRLNKSSKKDLLMQIKEIFELEQIPYTIEGYDNSHLMGEASVGAIIFWEDEFKKQNYRHYNLSSKDEYAQMKELLTRRVENLEKNPLPNLLVIDGGKTLYDLAVKIIKQKNIFVDIVAIAKEKENSHTRRAKGGARDIIWCKKGELRLNPDDKRLQFIQKIRDEAHRFALSFHKEKKLKMDKKISLLAKKGIGEATIKKLLLYFGSFENIKNAEINEIEKVIGEKKAKIIKGDNFDTI